MKFSIWKHIGPLLSLCLGMSSAYAYPTNTSLTSKLNMGLQSSAAENTDDSLGSNLNISFEFLGDLSPYSRIEISPVMRFRSGYIQSDLFDPSSTGNQIALEHASLELHSSDESLMAQGGIIQATRYTSRILSSRFGNTGFLGSYKWSNFTEDQNMKWTSIIIVPSTFQQNYSFDERREPPRVMIHTFNFDQEESTWGLNARLTQFTAFALTEGLADDANTRGNSIRFNPNDIRTEFIYGFNITELELNWKTRVFNEYSLEMQWIGLRNALAPQGLNSGYQLGGTLISSDFNREIRAGYQYFYLEPDVAISPLSSIVYGTNRVGHTLEFSYNDKKANTFRFQLTERDAIYRNGFQLHEYLVRLEWETQYAIF